MAIKFLILVVAIAAFAFAVNGRGFKTTDELDEEKTFFKKHPFPPYFKGFGGFGKPGYKGWWKKGWFGGKPVIEKPIEGENPNGGFDGNGTTGGDSSGGNTGTGGIGSLENNSGLSNGSKSRDAKVVGRGHGDKRHGQP